MAMKYHRKISVLHLQIYSRCLLLLKPPPKREAKAHEVYQNSLRTEAEARVVNGTGAELDQIRLKTQMMLIAYASQGHQPPEANGSHQLIDTHLETFVSSTLYEVEEERVGVPVKGGLNEALFPIYWNGDNRPVLRVQKLLQNTWSFHIITRRRFQPYGFLASHVDLQILQSLFTGEDDTWKSWLKAVMPAVLNLQWPRTAELKSRI
ncbi:hypothetical protein DY000_02041607 [Brassica cretica]|uniref:Uncharacterized protein n=1 Tax=Brassica cretica TaxID=69181 RepID=A0ABQ7B7H6_BRACR|nr:hypothetical protein DY000_02041607 [Brassica cretica]